MGPPTAARLAAILVHLNNRRSAAKNASWLEPPGE